MPTIPAADDLDLALLTEEEQEQLAQLTTSLYDAETLLEFIERIAPNHCPPPLHLLRLIELIQEAKHRRIRACVSMPPRHGKTLTILRALAWWIQSSPADTCGFFSYNSDFAESKSALCRDIAVHAGVQLRTTALREWRNHQGGGLLAGGAGSGLTGQGISGLCFPAGTMIATERGPMDIAELAVSPDKPLLLSFDHGTRRVVTRRIVAAASRWVDELAVVHTGGGRTVRATDNHPFWTEERGYQEAGLLCPGDSLVVLPRVFQGPLGQGQPVRCVPDSVSHVERSRSEPVLVWDLQVEGTHCFFADEVLVHNCIVDDPFKDRVEADSINNRETIWEWFNEVAFTRMEGASIIVVHTRWHPDDLIGRLEELGGWDIINFPALSEGEADIFDRQEGEALWPERFPASELVAIRHQINEWSFAALYQGRPRPRGATVFGDPVFFDPSLFDPKGCVGIIGVDPAASEKTSADHSVMVALAIRKRPDGLHDVFVMDVHRGQWSIPKLVRELQAFRQRWWGAPMAVEAVAGFKAVPQMLVDIDPSLEPFLRPAPALGDKLQRAQPFAAAWNNGRVYVPSNNPPWLHPYLAELKRFTGIKDPEDDQVDASSHGYNAIVQLPPAVRRGAVAQPSRYGVRS